MGPRAQSPATLRLLTNAVPVGGRGLEALVTEAVEGALRVVAEAVAPTHGVVGTLVYVCGTVETSVWGALSLTLLIPWEYLFMWSSSTKICEKQLLNTAQENSNIPLQFLHEPCYMRKYKLSNSCESNVLRTKQFLAGCMKGRWFQPSPW